MSRNNQQSIQWGALLVTLMGLAWCGYVAFPSSGSASGCVTSGCAILSGKTIAGIPAWWFGGAFFFILSVLCLRGARYMAWNFARLGLFLDSCLLLAMFFIGPCTDCLIVAVFFALCCLLLHPRGDGWFEKVPPKPILLPIWLGLFLGNVCLAGNEYITPMTVGEPGSQEIRVYFSPSCPACRDALIAFDGKASFYPVKEKEGDFEAIVRLQTLLEAGVPMADAITYSRDENAPPLDISIFKKLFVEAQLVRNQSTVLRQGFTSLPLIQINGMPSGFSSGVSVSPSYTPAPPVDNYQPGGLTSRRGDGGPDVPPDMFQGLDELGTCSRDSDEPCE